MTKPDNEYETARDNLIKKCNREDITKDLQGLLDKQYQLCMDWGRNFGRAEVLESDELMNVVFQSRYGTPEEAQAALDQFHAKFGGEK